MKTNSYLLLLTLCALLFTLNIYQFIKSEDNQIIYDNPNFDNPVFIWNDDLEGLPVDGTPILLEFSTKNKDTIYIGSIDGYESPEYQFTTTDDSITVTDFGRPVGTVKIEGQLKQLINQDNE